MARGPGVGFYGKVRIPTIGHRKAIEQAKGIAKQVGGKLTVGLSGTSEPLTPALKKSLAEKLFNYPVMSGNEHTKTLSHFLAYMSNKHDELHLVAGSDRAGEYKNFLSKYNGKPDRAGKVPFNFKKWSVHEVSGERQESNKDPRKMSQDELERSVSASLLEKLAKEGKYDYFKAYHPGMPESLVRKLFTQIRKGNNLNEEMTRKELAPMLDSFVSFASDKLGLKSAPSIRYKTDDDEYNSFAAYSPADNELSIYTKGRHPMDVFRSVAHELVHHKQNEDGRLKNPAEEGKTGSPIENEANAEAGKIMRWFAKTNPEYFKLGAIVEETLTEGINDPGIFKAIFLAGGPGSGKDFILKNALSGHGLVEINSDIAFEFLMKKEGLDFRMPEEQRIVRDLVRGRAKNMTKEQQRLALAGRLGLIINGTADDLNKMEKIKKDLENMGYDTMMVFVNTSDDVSKQRNISRGQQGGRMVPEMIRAEKWRLTQENMQHFRQIFGGGRFIVVDNSYDINTVGSETKKYLQSRLTSVYKDVKGFVNMKPDNAEALKWMQDQKIHRGLNEDLRKWFREKWVRFDTKGNIKGPCAREPGEGKPKCRPLASARAMSKKERARAALRKRRKDPVADRPGKGGKPINVQTEAATWAQQAAIAISKKESGKYNKNGKRIKEEILNEKNVPTNPELWARAKSMARSKFDVYPSAYANGWASKWYKSKGGGWKSVNEDQSKVPMSKVGKVKNKLANVDEAFSSFMEENTPAQREWGKTSLTNIYKRGTPGQYESEAPKQIMHHGQSTKNFDMCPGAVMAFSKDLRDKSLDDGALHAAIVAVDKYLGMEKQAKKAGKATQDQFDAFMNAVENAKAKIEALNTTTRHDYHKVHIDAMKELVTKKEDNNLPKGTLPVADGIGPETTQYRPMTGYGYTIPMEESIVAWMNRPSTQAKFIEKYGELAEQKLLEAATRLQESGCGCESSAPKSIKKIKEGMGLGYNDMGTVATQRKDEVREAKSLKSYKKEIHPQSDFEKKTFKEETPAWQRKEGKNPEGGLNRKGIASYRRANPGSKLSMAVTTKPSKLKPGSKAAKRRKSFCRRMKGMRAKLTSAKTANDPNSRINKSLRKWNCEE